MIDRLTVERILEAANIVDVVSDFVALKRSGANLKGLCPFHDDRTPSFMVSPVRNYCKCFACGEGGSPVGFVMKHESLSYPDALRYLARKYGIKIEERELTQEEMQSRSDRESMLILNEWARDWFRNQLWKSADGRALGLAYFRSRGFRDDILERFQVGFCPDTREAIFSKDALKEGYKERYLLNNQDESEPRLSVGTGLSLRRESGELRDRFRGRVIWPIYTVGGRVAGFGGRVLDAATKGVAVKYLNSPESIVYSKRRELFGLYQARQAIRKNDLCYLVEGYTDVMAMHQQGVENVVASSGTALTTEQVSLIHRMTENITVIFDGDEAGIHASERGIGMLLSRGMNVKLLLLPEGEDPDSFARKHTAEEFRAYLRERQVDFVTYKASLTQGGAAAEPEEQERLIRSVAETIAVIPDEIRRTVYIRHASRQLGIPERLVQVAVNAQRSAAPVQGDFAERSRAMQARAAQVRGNAAQMMRGDTAQVQGNTATVQGNTATASGTMQSTSEGSVRSGAGTMPGTAEGFVRSGAGTMPGGAGSVRRASAGLSGMERAIVQMIVRHGGEPFCRIEEEDGTERALSLAEYVSYCLQDDGITLRSAVARRVLDEAVEQAHRPDFRAERYFINHEDEEIRELALELGPDSEELSRLFDEPHLRGRDADASGTSAELSGTSDGSVRSGAGTMPGTSAELSGSAAESSRQDGRLQDTVPSLIASYKLSIVRQQLQTLIEEMKNPAVRADRERSQRLMSEFTEKSRLARELARQCGDRVVLK